KGGKFMVEVRRKANESTGSLLRRFSRFVQQSGVLVKAKKDQFRAKRQNERKEKLSAIMGVHLRELRKRLEKLGKYDEETFEEEKRKLKQELGF
ncbi:MAG TPA: hypothetical protein VEK36_00225, partial [Candidatus Paceibacterota bacterium]|nr:hypothetical protein [Candidatus Paceibacterota bacterium]